MRARSARLPATADCRLQFNSFRIPNSGLRILEGSAIPLLAPVRTTTLSLIPGMKLCIFTISCVWTC
jgi:hypothetical protein